MKKVIIGIEGMRCPHCEAHVRDALNKAYNPRSIKVSHVDKNAILNVESSINEEEVKSIVKEAGYTVTSFEEKEEKKGFFARIFAK